MFSSTLSIANRFCRSSETATHGSSENATHCSIGLVLATLILSVIFPLSLDAHHGLPSTAREPSNVLLKDVFVSGQGGYHTYRIPALIRSGDGSLLAFCEGRKKSRSDTGDIDLVLRRSLDGGKSWLPLQVIWDDGSNTCGNPCPVLDQSTGVLWLAMTWNSGDIHESKILPGTGPRSRRVFVCHSKDNGLHWSRPEEITESVKRPSWTWYATGPGAGIQIQNGKHRGRLVIPCDHKNRDSNNQVTWHSHVFYSDDAGKTWQLGGIAPKEKVNECEVVELNQGILQLNMRNYDHTTRARQTCLSDDGGQSWHSQSHDKQLVEPTCQASVRRIRFPTDKTPGLIVFSNPADPRNRRNLTIRGSHDEAKTWSTQRTLYSGSAAYSCLAATSETEVGCLFERDEYSKITLALFDENWLQKNQQYDQNN